MHIRPVGPILALLLVVAASGCSGGDEEQIKPVAALPNSGTPAASAPATPPRSPSATPTATTAGPTPESAAAFVRAYYAAVNKSALIGSSKGLTRYAAKSCSICREYVASTQYYEKRGQRLDGPPLVLTSATAYPLEGKRTTVAIVLWSPKGNVVDARGRKIDRLSGRARYSASVALTWGSDGWIITDILEFP